jgi:hypothetical protein
LNGCAIKHNKAQSTERQRVILRKHRMLAEDMLCCHGNKKQQRR